MKDLKSLLFFISIFCGFAFSMEEVLTECQICLSGQEKQFEWFKDLPIELRQYIINIYLAQEFAQERNIDILIKRVLKFRAQIREINNLATQKSFWDNLFDNFFYSLLHFNTKLGEVNRQLDKSVCLISKIYRKFKNGHYIYGQTPIESQFWLNFIIPALASRVHRINESRIFFGRNQYDEGKGRAYKKSMTNIKLNILWQLDSELKVLIDQVKAKTNKLWHPEVILKLCEIRGDQHQSSLKALIEAGANVDVQNEFGSTPLILAVESAYNNIVEILLEAGANTNVLNNRSQSPLNIALINAEDNKINAELCQKFQKIFDMLKEFAAKRNKF